MEARVHAALQSGLRTGVSHTLAMTLSHYDLDLPKIFEGLVVAEDEEGREGEVFTELLQQAEEATTTLVGHFQTTIFPDAAEGADATDTTDVDAREGGGRMPPSKFYDSGPCKKLD